MYTSLSYNSDVIVTSAPVLISKFVDIVKPISLSINSPARMRTCITILATKPMESPTAASFKISIVYPNTVSYSGSAISAAENMLSDMQTAISTLSLTFILLCPNNGATATKHPVLTTTSKNDSKVNVAIVKSILHYPTKSPNLPYIS